MHNFLIIFFIIEIIKKKIWFNDELKNNIKKITLKKFEKKI